MATDASGTRMDGILHQEWEYGRHLVAFYSQKLMAAEHKIHTSEEDKSVIVLATKHWKQYLGD